MNATTSPATSTARTGRAGFRAVVVAVGVAFATLLGLLGTASPASAADYIQPPAGLWCDTSTSKLVVSPPRVWATYRTETVWWGSQIQRWNPNLRQWVNYGPQYYNTAAFNIYGQSPTSWSTGTTTSGGMYFNNTMHYPVYHHGYYRLFSLVKGTQNSLQWGNFVDNARYCQM